jgi:hypothetical protein
MQIGDITFNASALSVAGSAAGALAVSLARPPAYGLSILGVVVLATTIFVQGNRTGQHYWWPWQDNDANLTSAETFWGLVGVVFIAVPLAVALVRAMAH